MKQLGDQMDVVCVYLNVLRATTNEEIMARWVDSAPIHLLRAPIDDLTDSAAHRSGSKFIRLFGLWCTQSENGTLRVGLLFSMAPPNSEQ